MTTETTPLTAATYPPTDKQKGALKTKLYETDPEERLRKPSWVRVKAPSSSGRFREIQAIVRVNHLVRVCEEAYKTAFVSAALGPLVRRSYHADKQAHAAGVF